MIHHVSIGARNISASKAFYDAALTPIGYTCLSADDASLGYGKDAVAFWISQSDKPVAADPKSGLHFCFVAPTRKGVEAFHKAALAHGGRDNGKPGMRKDYGPNYFAAFAIDPDGYRIEAYCSAEA
jgi:catechol 2,3-dioxygenase-like lactoylglutathione lyase family enzyme